MWGAGVRILVWVTPNSGLGYSYARLSLAVLRNTYDGFFFISELEYICAIYIQTEFNLLDKMDSGALGPGPDPIVHSLCDTT